MCFFTLLHLGQAISTKILQKLCSDVKERMPEKGILTHKVEVCFDTDQNEISTRKGLTAAVLAMVQ